MTSKYHAKISALFLATTLSVPALSGAAYACNSTISSWSVTPTSGSVAGRDITTPNMATDPDRDYGALILRRTENNVTDEIPMLEGSTLHPFDGTFVEFLDPDWVSGDEFLMRLVCDQDLYEDGPKSRLLSATPGASSVPVRVMSRRPLPQDFKDVRNDIKKFKNDIPKPEPFGRPEGAGDIRTITVRVPGWTEPVIDKRGFQVQVSAALVRRALGSSGNPGQTPPSADDKIDRKLQIPDHPELPGETIKYIPIRVVHRTGGPLLTGEFNDVFGEKTTDKVTVGNQYRYHVVVTYTLLKTNAAGVLQRYHTQIEGKELKVKIWRDRIEVLR